MENTLDLDERIKQTVKEFRAVDRFKFYHNKRMNFNSHYIDFEYDETDDFDNIIEQLRICVGEYIVRGFNDDITKVKSSFILISDSDLALLSKFKCIFLKKRLFGRPISFMSIPFVTRSSLGLK